MFCANKKLILGLIFSFNMFAGVINPELSICQSESFEMTEKLENSSFAFVRSIELEGRIVEQGDPAIWSTLYSVKVTFPASDVGSACFKLSHFLLKNAKSIGYDARYGRLLELTGLVASYDDNGTIGEQEAVVRLRINQATRKATLE